MLHTPCPDLDNVDQVSENPISSPAPLKSQGLVENQIVEKTNEQNNFQPLVVRTNSRGSNHPKDLLAENITEVSIDFKNENEKQNVITGTSQKRLANPNKESNGSRKRKKPSTEKKQTSLQGK